MTDQDSLRTLTAEVRAFAIERDWEKFHDPKSLVLALMGEVGELAELFQWIPAGTVLEEFAAPERKQRAAEEISDVLTYLLRLADILQIDLGPAVWAKLQDSKERFAPGDVLGAAPVKT